MGRIQQAILCSEITIVRLALSSNILVLVLFICKPCNLVFLAAIGIKISDKKF